MSRAAGGGPCRRAPRDRGGSGAQHAPRGARGPACGAERDPRRSTPSLEAVVTAAPSTAVPRIRAFPEPEVCPACQTPALPRATTAAPNRAAPRAGAARRPALDAPRVSPSTEALKALASATMRSRSASRFPWTTNSGADTRAPLLELLEFSPPGSSAPSATRARFWISDVTSRAVRTSASPSDRA